MKSRRILSIIGLILAAAVLLGIGFAVGRNEIQASVPDATDAAKDIVHTEDDVPALNLTVTRVGNTDSQIFSPEEIGNNFNQGMSYCGVTDVSISLNSGDERLEDAICRLVSQIVAQVPVYHLECLPDAAAARLSCRTVFGDDAPNTLR